MVDLIIIVSLLALHGIIALCEMAFVSSKHFRLQEKYQKGNKSAGLALHLLEKPEELLSTMQFGITLTEIIAGVFGGVSLADKITPVFESVSLLKPYAANISFILVVSFITYLAVIIGDLVPKSIGLRNPERYAIFFAPFINMANKLCYPIVKVLSLSTKLILRILLIRRKNGPPVTADELKYLIYEAYEHGVLQSRESELLQSMLKLNKVTVKTMMNPVDQIIWINYSDPFEKIHEIMLNNNYSRFPVYRDSFNNVVGVLSSKEFIAKYYTEGVFQLEEILFDPLIVKPGLDALKLLEKFRDVRSYMAIVMSAEGEALGIVTMHNLVETIVGKLPEFYETEEDRFFQRDDGTYLLDADLSLNKTKELLSIDVEIEQNVTLGSYFHQSMNRIPKVGDKVILEKYNFEIVDMDGMRVDKILAKNIAIAQ
ncbi:MAG: hemolysin family protein [Ignavibacteriaceae bacterium]|jgi:putative hemolysin|nr:hemolysin family protein [Ignavibacteriaceae bacterium]